MPLLLMQRLDGALDIPHLWALLPLLDHNPAPCTLRAPGSAPPPMTPHVHPALPLQVVSNAVNSLDMDKVDYLVRDTLLCGVALQQDCRAFLPLVTQHCRVRVARRRAL